eukprot:GEMP01078918.1.p1 GENE.GEMP01078918.1~~GEMP01078918.1.p1  ORF type:complete len:154 (+),score=35.59 GEMP01078918.1:176-637(+)
MSPAPKRRTTFHVVPRDTDRPSTPSACSFRLPIVASPPSSPSSPSPESPASPLRLQLPPGALQLPSILVQGQRLIVKGGFPLVLRSTEVICSSMPILGLMEEGLPIRIASSCDTTPSGKVRALVQTEEEFPTIGWCTIKDDDGAYLEPAPTEV